LREISIVSAWPAYPQTSIAARSNNGATYAEKYLAIMMEGAQ
jgi:phage head maturation protease